MKRSRVLVLGVVLLLGLGLLLGACGSDEDAKAELTAALDKVDQAVAKFQEMGLSSTVPEIKAARDEVAPVWEEVVAAAEKVDGADVEAVQKAWDDLDAAVSAVPDDANIMEAAGVLAPVTNLLNVIAQLRTLVTPEE
jgi:hypothetical protein